MAARKKIDKDNRYSALMASIFKSKYKK